jgi:hypothetical protein
MIKAQPEKIIGYICRGAPGVVWRINNLKERRFAAAGVARRKKAS